MKDHINVCIPTIDRLALLSQTIKSIINNDYKYLSITVIVDDGRKVYFNRLKMTVGRHPQIKMMFNEKRLGWPKSMNRIFWETDHDYYLYASDDLNFHPNTITKAMADMKRYFPDGDGVIGLTQENLRHGSPGAFGLVGRKWMNRFPKRKMFNPKYLHFCGDSELLFYSRQIHRFYLSKAAVFHNRPHDRCRALAHLSITRDRKIWFPRRRARRVWPKFK